MSTFPSKLKKGDTVAVIAPSQSLSIIKDSIINLSINTLKKLGLGVIFGKNTREQDIFNSSSIESRVEDLHWAFENPQVKGIFTAIGGFNSNQLLNFIDWSLIKRNPKIFCGYSDATALANAIYKQVELVTYSGPHFSSFGSKRGIEYTTKAFTQCLMENNSFEIVASNNWYDKDAKLVNSDMVTISEGYATGSIVGGNQCTLNLLQGTDFMPSLEKAILFLEDDYEVHAQLFDRDLQSLLHLPNFSQIQGIIIGRFQLESKINIKALKEIILSKKELSHIPVVANVDFGHTFPFVTFPIGGTCSISAHGKNISIRVNRH